jgi:hypothetical protein
MVYGAYPKWNTAEIKIYSVQVEDEDIEAAFEAASKAGYPIPENEIVFIENDQVINRTF